MNMVETVQPSNADRAPTAPARGPMPGASAPARSAIEPKIEVNNLNFFYGKYHALKNINLRHSREAR